MKDNIYCHNLRLNLNIPEHLEVHGHLMNYDQSQFKSMNAYIIEAIRVGAEKVDCGGEASPTLSEAQLKELEDRVTERIQKDVLNEVLKTLLGAMAKPGMVPIYQEKAEPEEEMDAELADLALDYFEE